MNFTEWLDSLVEPLYESDGIPHCPPGYRFDKKNLMCVPKTQKDDVGEGQRGQAKKDFEPGNGPTFNVIGTHGQNGQPYAYAENIAPNPYDYQYVNGQWIQMEDKDYERWDKEAKEFEKKDRRMKYGKEGKASSLRPGEVRKPNSHGGFDSNK